MNAWRKELQEMLKEMQLWRPPALRRSGAEDSLYATDLPSLAKEAALHAFCARLTEKGWQCREERGWLHLRRPAAHPPEDWFSGPFGPEAGCCASLLRRHAETSADPEGGDRAAFALIKAGEEGPDPYERVCRRLHGEWAAALRRGEALPKLSLRYFGEPSEQSTEK